MPLIFVSNDDGIESPGIRATVEAVCVLGEVLVVAPRRQQSTTGRGLGGHKDERLTPAHFPVGGASVRAFTCEATPAQTVLHGLNVLCAGRRPDLMVSGINFGENLGSNITLSGTVGAAIEAASVGVPALASSLQTDMSFHHNYGEVDWHAAVHFTRYFAQRMLAHGPLPADVDLMNLVIPESATPETPWRLTRQSRPPYFSTQLTESGLDARIGDGRVGVFCDRGAIEPDSDIAAILYDKIVSVTPLSLDFTSRTDFSMLAHRLQGGGM